jgi:CheY-like chemotaxis protein
MDLYMPGVDGFEATRRLKAAGAAPRVVVMTAHQSEENRVRAQAAGADAFLLKHQVAHELIGVIGGLTGQNGQATPPGA